MTALLLLGPQTPLLFQGQEFAATAPFLYFADHEEKLAALVRKGRASFLRQFPSIAEAADADPHVIAEPSRPETFERCKLDFREREEHAEVYALHRDLLRLRREDDGFGSGRSDLVHAAVLSPHALLLRFSCEAGDRLLVVNLGPDLDLSSAPEPMLAPPEARDWRLLWSSEDPRYGGSGSGEPYALGGFRLPAESALAFAADPVEPEPAAAEDGAPPFTSGGEASRRDEER
jgi:maltooligosyltrehalose trehalohydrolase